MPPVYGIFSTVLHPPDKHMISRMHNAARYKVKREIETTEIAAGFMAYAVVHHTTPNDKTPATATDGNWVIIADASLYKRDLKEIAAPASELSNGDNDAQYILGAYLKWGIECVQYLYGDFAFVIFNVESGEVFCSRDPLGVRPLYYCYDGMTLIYGSEIRYIVAALETTPLLRKAYLIDTLIQNQTSRDLTPYKNIFRLLPGCSMHFLNKKKHIQQYWQPDNPEQLILKKEEDYINLFRQRLMSAVSIRCKHLPNICAELSGGLDSSGVTGTAAYILGSDNIPLTAMSNILPDGVSGDITDEMEYIQSMLNHVPLLWTGVSGLKQDLIDILADAVRIHGSFIQQNFSAFNTGIFEAAAVKGCNILLSGFGGDEMVSARLPLSWNDMIKGHHWKVLCDEIKAQKNISAVGKSLRAFMRYYLVKPGLQASYKKPLNQTILEKRFKELPLNEEFSERNGLKNLFFAKSIAIHFSNTNEELIAQITGNYVSQRLEYSYAAAAQYGLEYRYPLLDKDLIETYLTMPAHLRINKGVKRYIFRKAIMDMVPEKIRTRTDKKGMPVPFVDQLMRNSKKLSQVINRGAENNLLNSIFDMAKFRKWHDKLNHSNISEMNYLMPGIFNNYLMIILYYQDHGEVNLNESLF